MRKDMTDAAHAVELEPQPIADQWMARCTCGWRAKASAYDFGSGMKAEVRRLADEHLLNPPAKP